MNLLAILRAGFDLAGQREPRLIRGMVLGVVAQAFTVAALVLVYLGLRDLLQGDATTGHAIALAAGMAACYVARLFLEAQALLDVYSGATAMLGRGRGRMLEHLRRLSMGYYSDARAGELVQAVTGDLEMVHQLWANAASGLSRTLAQALFAGLVIAVIDWRLALVCAVTLPAALWVLSWSQRVLAERGDRVTAAMGDISARLLEYTEGIKVLRAFQLTGRRMATLVASLTRYHEFERQTELAVSPLLLAYRCVLEISFTVLIVVGAWLFTSDRTDALAYIGVLVLGIGFYHPLGEAATHMSALRFGFSALTRIRVVLDVPEQTHSPLAPTLRAFDVEFDHVSFAYDEGVPVLRDISLRLEPGTTTALVGASGSGKSTVASLLLRSWDADAGTVRVGGMDVRDMDFDELNRHIATVFQDVYLFRDTVANNIRMGRPGATDEEVFAAARRARCHDFVAAMPQGYETVVGEGGATLSGGERQRISIARALLKDAPILVLDEATASVDLDNEAQIQQALLEFRGNRTVLVIAHRLWTIRGADQIALLDRGEIIERGTHAELIALGGRYAYLWKRQEQARGWTLDSRPSIATVEHLHAEAGGGTP